jgi:GNAT superfamily N-acetyltransferase
MPHPLGANPDDAPAGPGVDPERSVSVRPAMLADVPRLAEINQLSWRHAYGGLVPAEYLASLDLESLGERWTTRIRQPGRRINLVCEIGGHLASYAVLGPYRTQQDAQREDTTGWGELYAIYTHPDLQGRGAASALHDAALTAMDAWNCPIVALWVLRDNDRARRWYGARGWRSDGASSEWLGSGKPLEEIRLVHRANGSLPPGSSRLGRETTGA